MLPRKIVFFGVSFRVFINKQRGVLPGCYPGVSFYSYYIEYQGNTKVTPLFIYEYSRELTPKRQLF